MPDWLRTILQMLGLVAPPVVLPPGPTGSSGASSPSGSSGTTSSTGPTSPTSPSPSSSTPTYPSGPIRALSPGSVPATSRWKNLTWQQVSRWEPAVGNATAKHDLPRGLLEGVLLVETNANHYTTGTTIGVNGRGSYRRPLTAGQVVVDTDPVPAIGIAQVKAAYHAAPGEDAWSPAGNIMLSARLLAGWIKGTGSWQGAIRRYHPGTDPDSKVTVEGYIVSIGSVMAELTSGTTTGPSGATGPGSGSTGSTGPGSLTFGRVPLPTFTDRRIPDAQNSAWDNLGKRAVKGVVLHRMLGTLWGTDGWFRGGGGASALTDWGVDHRTAETLMWNSPGGYGASGVSPNRAPWASGPWNRPAGSDLICLVDKHGVNVINRDLPSIEISGQQNDPLSEAAIKQIAAMIAYHADQAKIPWNVFPRNPHTGCMFIYWHWEACGKAYKGCPWGEVEKHYDRFVSLAQGIMKEHQTKP